MVYKMSKWISYHPKTIIIVCLALLVPAIIGYICTGINYDILSYLPKDLESVQGEELLDTAFNNASSSFIVVNNASQKDLEKMKNKIEKIDGVYSVTCINTLADPSIPTEILPDVLTDIFYSEDKESSLMMVQYTNSGSSEETMNAIKTIRSVMNKQCFLSGVSAIGVDTKDLVDKEAPVYIAVAIALALVVLIFTMNSFILPFVLLTALGVAVIYNMGTNIIFGQISYITQAIAAILQLGVTMDYSVFLMDRYEEECKKHPGDNKLAMSFAIESTFTSLAGSSLTTVFGFLALCFMQFTLGLDIGLVMAKGVLFGVVTVVTFLPALILMLDKAIKKTHKKSIIPPFQGISNFTVKHRKVLAIIFLILFIPAYLVQSNLNVYYNMDKALPQDLDSISSLSVLKERFNMATTHFIICDANMSSSAMTQMTNEVEEVDGVVKVLSLSSFVGPSIPLSILPDEVKDICVAKKDDGKEIQLIMINSEYSGATDEENAQIDNLYKIVKKYDKDAYLTGEGVLEKDLIDVTNRDFIVTNIISIAAIFILIMICLKSFSLPVILVMGIELAILLNKAISVILGAEVPFIGPTVIGCVQLGATVDYAILLATRFKEELSNGQKKEDAMRVAANSASRSIFQSAIVFFAATFGVYLLCNISIVKSICGMLARGSIISAIVIIVFVAPTLVCCESFINKTSIKWREPTLKRATANGAEEPQDEKTEKAKEQAPDDFVPQLSIKDGTMEKDGNPYHPSTPPMKKHDDKEKRI